MSDELHRRLRALEDEAAIVRRLHIYGHAIDAGDEAKWLDCFTADGVFEGTGRRPGHTMFRVQGREALSEFINGHTRRPYQFHMHGVIEPLVEVDGDRATCTSYFIVLQEHEKEPRVRVFGRYRDQLRRDSDDAWRFAVRRAEIDAMLRGLPALVDGLPAERRQPPIP